MGYLKLCFAVAMAVVIGIEAEFQIGLGRYDVTGPSVEVPFMGYGNPVQRGVGIHLRQFARAFIIQDESGNRVVFVNADIGMFSNVMKKDIVSKLQARFGNLYTIDNIMMAPTHTHGGPGGYHQLVLYDITCFGFIAETYNPIVNGVAEAIARAHDSMAAGSVFYSEVKLRDFGVNRSPVSYEANPESERNQYDDNVDNTLQQIKFVNAKNQIVGAFHWVATHAVSMNNSNFLISSDNLGYAAYLLEQEYNPGQLVGKGLFVGAFSTSHSGDISPNILGPRCYRTGLPCDALESSCPDDDVCMAKGPGETDFENTKIIGSNIYKAASEGLKNAPLRELTRNVGFVHQFVEMARQAGKWFNKSTQRYEAFRGCLPALGFSFAAGTTDGPGAYQFFTQGDTTGNEFFEQVRDLLHPPTDDDMLCHFPKPILLMTGRMTIPYLWQPQSVPTQILRIGDAVILGVPAEMTTMVGRRLRSTIQELGKIFGEDLVVLPTGMANTYASYVVTWEEYQVQRYEAASTPYGPHTLTIYQQQYARLYTALANKYSVEAGPAPPDQREQQLTFLLPVTADSSGSASFGAVLAQPQETYRRGREVTATFVSGSPRNDLMTESSFFFVQQQQDNGDWVDVATDANWETRFVWRRTNQLLGQSEIDFYWNIPQDAAAGVYRIRHQGASRGLFTGVRRYQGFTRTFIVA